MHVQLSATKESLGARFLGSPDDETLSKKLYISKCCSWQESARKSAEAVAANAANLVAGNEQRKKDALATACAINVVVKDHKRKKVTSHVQIITPFDNGDAYRTHLADCGNHSTLLEMALKDVRRLAGERAMEGARAHSKGRWRWRRRSARALWRLPRSACFVV